MPIIFRFSTSYSSHAQGPTPFDGVRYVAPAVQQTFPIDVDLNRVREVTYCVHQDGSVARDAPTCLGWLADKVQSGGQGGGGRQSAHSAAGGSRAASAHW